MKKLFILLLFVTHITLGQSITMDPTEPSHLRIFRLGAPARLSLSSDGTGDATTGTPGSASISLQSTSPGIPAATNEIRFNGDYILRQTFSLGVGAGTSISTFGIYKQNVPLLYHTSTGLELAPTLFKGTSNGLATFNNTSALAANVNSSIHFKTGDYFTGLIQTTGLDNSSARLSFFTGANANQGNLLERVSITNTGLVGIGLTNPNQWLDVNGRVRIRHNGATAGIWMSSSTNGLTDADGAFYGNKGDTETGIWLGNAWRFWVNSTGNITATGLAGTGTRNVYADATGMLTTTAPAPKTDYFAVAPAAFKAINNNSGTFTAEDINGKCSMSAGSTDKLITGINLPTGASITSVQVFYVNTDNTKSFYVEMYRATYSSLIFNIVQGLTTQVSANSTDIKSKVFTVDNLNGTINNGNNTYSLRISPETTGGDPSTWSANMGIQGVKITYTL